MATNEQINSAAQRSDAWIRSRQKAHKDLMLDSIKKLQDKILDLSRQLSVDDNGKIQGPQQNWTTAQKLHDSIIKQFNAEYPGTAKKITDDFENAHKDTKANFKTMDEAIKFTGADKDMFKALRDGYYQDYLAVGQAAQDKIVKSMYNHVIGGSSFSQFETSIRSALLGSAAVSALGRPLANYTKLYARDMIMNYHNDVMQTKARDLGMDHFKYTGTVMSRSRRFCIQRVGGVFTKAEIESWTGKWAGKSGPALSYRGGYNCRHHWQPVRKKWLTPSAQGDINSLNKLDKDGNIIKGKKKPKPKPKPKQDKSKYIPAKNIKEAEKWANDNITAKADYTGLDLDVANNINKSMDVLVNIKGHKRLDKLIVQADNTGTAYASAARNEIYLHPRIHKMENFKGADDWQTEHTLLKEDIKKLEARKQKRIDNLSPEELKTDRRLKRYDQNILDKKEALKTSADVPFLIDTGKGEISNIITHEFGHVLKNRYYTKQVVGLSQDDALDKYMELDRTLYGDIYSSNHSHFVNNIGKYGGSSPDEMLAESFNLAMSDDKDKLPGNIQEYLDILIKSDLEE